MENMAYKLNLVVDYIEKHLTEEIDQEKIAQIAGCSYFDVGRMFSLIAGVGISDYIRKRRMTLAGFDLKYNNAKVIDVAMRYGYDSPVSFARAFQSFHGFNPSSADKNNAILNIFPRLVYQIQAKEMLDVIYNETMTVDGKEYEASFFGENDMSLWSKDFCKRKYWRLENAYEDFKDRPTLNHVLPYNNYPPIDIEPHQVFVVDYYKDDESVDRKFYIADGTVWQDMPCTREFVLHHQEPVRTDRLTIGEKVYKASYFGQQDMSYWSEYATMREFWRLENAGNDFDGFQRLSNVLPYNNYPPIVIEVGQVFVVDYHTTKGTVERRYYIADGTVWEDMPSTREIDV